MMIEVLLVDDESYVTESLALTIPWTQLGIEGVHQAVSAIEALEILDNYDIDILITDIRMPEQTGLDLIEQVKVKWPNLRTVLLTGYSDFEYAKHALKLRASDYLLKPVDDEDFMKCMMQQVNAVRDEWKRVEERNEQQYSRKVEHSVLKKQLMHEILLDRQRNSEALDKLLKQYEIGIEVSQSSLIMTVQLAGRFIEMDRESSELIEYAVGNIAEEVFDKPYKVWPASSPHDNVVIILTVEEGHDAHFYDKARIRALCQSFQEKVSSYLNGGISIVVSEWFVFPKGAAQQYRDALATLYRIQIDEPSLIMLDENARGLQEPHSALEELFKPPTFINLLDGGQWQTAKEKLELFFSSYDQQQHTRERIYEAFIAISNGMIYIAHKKGIDIQTIDPQRLHLLPDRSIMMTVSSLKTWSLDMIDLLSMQYDESDKYQKKHIIKQVQELVNKELGIDTSVKSIADRVYLHPVYLSKLYKSETGESLGDYIIRMRMEKAVYMLKSTNKKIYEITTELGYQNPQYFSKIFKKHYGCTPNEFRDQ